MLDYPETPYSSIERRQIIRAHKLAIEQIESLESTRRPVPSKQEEVTPEGEQR